MLLVVVIYFVQMRVERKGLRKYSMVELPSHLPLFSPLPPSPHTHIYITYTHLLTHTYTLHTNYTTMNFLKSAASAASAAAKIAAGE